MLKLVPRVETTGDVRRAAHALISAVWMRAMAGDLAAVEVIDSLLKTIMLTLPDDRPTTGSRIPELAGIPERLDGVDHDDAALRASPQD